MTARFSIGCFIASLAVGLGTLGVVPSADGEEPPSPLQIRQRIIRISEDELLHALAKKPSDEALAKQLLDWVTSGVAKVVSDVSTKAGPGANFQVKDGEVYKWVVENDQDSDAPVLTPTSWQDVFLGTSLQGEYRLEQNVRGIGVDGPADPFSPASPVPVKPEEIPGGMETCSVGWNMEVRSRMATKVRWPLVWPENRKPQVGWYEQDDFLLQNLIMDARIQPGRRAILAFLSPALDLESAPAKRELDVVLAEADAGKASIPEASGTKHPAVPRVHLFGYGLNHQDAMDLLNARRPGEDATLLTKLQTLVKEGKATRRLVCGSQALGSSTTLGSVREHSYPTEMPTIPSAWNTRPVGTRLEMELHDRSLQLNLEHHPARFRWAEWPCALDAPELIMNQPQFFVQRVQTNVEIPKDNVALVAAMRTPDCLKGSDKGPAMGETMILFAELNQPEGTPPLKAHVQEPPRRHLDLEAVVFELPSSEAAEWRGAGDLDTVDDEQRFQKALEKVKQGTANVVCQLSVAALSGQRTIVEYVEELVYVTEYNPVDHNPTGRYRPTALERDPVGSIWTVEPTFMGADGIGGNIPVIHVNTSLRHDVLPAVQPTLKEAMKYTQDRPYRLPVPTFTRDEWVTTAYLLSGKARCLGPVQPKGARFQDRIHVAFLRGTVRK